MHCVPTRSSSQPLQAYTLPLIRRLRYPLPVRLCLRRQEKGKDNGVENGRMQVFLDRGSGRSELRHQVSYENSGNHHESHHTCFVGPLVPFGIAGNVLRLLMLLLMLLARKHLLEELELSLREPDEGTGK